MTGVVRAGERYRSVQDGIESWHCFAAGAHFDPGNVSYGAIIGCDEHLIAPGAGFDWHPHRGVDIVSWVLSGLLLHQGSGQQGSAHQGSAHQGSAHQGSGHLGSRHLGSGGAEYVVRPGQALVQSTSTGIRHREVNASVREPLRMVQTTLLATVLAGAAPMSELSAEPPVDVDGGHFAVWHDGRTAQAQRWHVFVAGGGWQLGDAELVAGDSVRGEGPFTATGSGDLLVVLLSD